MSFKMNSIALCLSTLDNKIFLQMYFRDYYRLERISGGLQFNLLLKARLISKLGQFAWGPLQLSWTYLRMEVPQPLWVTCSST